MGEQRISAFSGVFSKLSEQKFDPELLHALIFKKEFKQSFGQALELYEKIATELLTVTPDYKLMTFLQGEIEAIRNLKDLIPLLIEQNMPGDNDDGTDD